MIIRCELKCFKELFQLMQSIHALSLMNSLTCLTKYKQIFQEFIEKKKSHMIEVILHQNIYNN